MNAAKTQVDDSKKGIAAATAATKSEETKSDSGEVFKVVRKRRQDYESLMLRCAL